MSEEKNNEVLKGIQEILYYYDEYQKGNHDGYIALHELAYCLRKTGNKRKYHALLFAILELLQKIKVFIYNPSLKEDVRYQELIKFCDEDLEYFKNVSAYLNEYLDYVIFEDDFEHLVDAFLLTVKLSGILNNIGDYFACINSILRTTASGVTYYYPLSIEKNRTLLEEDIEGIKKLLVMNEDSED